MGKARIAAIGPATAEALKNFALTVDAIPGEYRGEAIIDAIGVEKIRGARILIPRAQVAREVLAKLLRERGARRWSSRPPTKPSHPSGAALVRIRETLSTGGYDLVAFTSSSTASNFVEITGKPKSWHQGGRDRAHHRGDRREARLRGCR